MADRAGNPFLNGEPWVVAVGQAGENTKAGMVDLYRSGQRWTVPEELMVVRQRFVKPVTESFARGLVAAYFPDDPLEVFIEGKLLWMSPPRPYPEATFDSICESVRLVPHGVSAEPDASGEIWWVISEDGERRPVATADIVVWQAIHATKSLAEAADLMAEKLPVSRSDARRLAAISVLPLVHTQVAHLDLVP